MSFKITWITHLKCILLSVLITILLGSIPNEIISNLLEKQFIVYPTASIIVNFYIYIIVLLIPLMAIHEFFHGLTYKIFGGKVIYGFKGIFAYTKEVSQIPIKKFKFLLVLMMPLFFISILSLLLPRWIGALVWFINLIGSSGDIYMFYYVLKNKNGTAVIDRQYGFDIV